MEGNLTATEIKVFFPRHLLAVKPEAAPLAARGEAAGRAFLAPVCSAKKRKISRTARLT